MISKTVRDKLGDFTGPVSEANYIDKAENFLDQESLYSEAIREIEKAKNL